MLISDSSEMCGQDSLYKYATTLEKIDEDLCDVNLEATSAKVLGPVPIMDPFLVPLRWIESPC